MAILHNFSKLKLRHLWVLSYLMLTACASAPPKIVEVPKPASTQGKTVELQFSSDSRDDFDAAMGYVKAEEYDKAIELFTKVIKSQPAASVPRINLALVYKKLGKLKLAEEQLKLALESDPENPVANNEYALLYRKTGRFAEARKLYEKIIDVYPNFNLAHRNLGILCDLYMKDYECALKHYVIYSSAVQDDKTVKIWIADLQKRLGK